MAPSGEGGEKRSEQPQPAPLWARPDRLGRPLAQSGAKAESMAPATGNLSSGRSGSDVTNGLAERWKSAAIGWPILRLLKHSRSNAYDRGAAFAADGVQTGAVRPTAAQTAASRSSSALSAAPTSTAALDSQAQVIRPTTAPSEP